MSLILSVPKSGKTGPVVYVNSKYGVIERELVIPHNAQAPEQQEVRGNFARITRRWRILTPEQRAAWRIASADTYTITRLGRQVALNPYSYFCRINFCRSDLGLSLFDLPPAVPAFAPNPIEELEITNSGGIITLKLRVPSLPAQYTVVQGASPRSPSVSCVQHFPNLGFLPAPVGGWSDITDLYVAWYGVPTVGKAIWVRTRQHIDGWNDLPKTTTAVVPKP
jgi:hypothetical protein